MTRTHQPRCDGDVVVVDAIALAAWVDVVGTEVDTAVVGTTFVVNA